MKKLINNTTIATVSLAFGTVLLIGMPAQARFDYDNWQPVKGQIHRQEDRLEKQLNKDYNKGLIDTNELAQLRRDLDGIKVQEDEFRMDHNGLGANDVKCIDKKLNQFQQDLNRAVADKIDLQPVQCNRQVQNIQQPQLQYEQPQVQ